MKRSGSWSNLFDSGIGFTRAKMRMENGCCHLIPITTQSTILIKPCSPKVIRSNTAGLCHRMFTGSSPPMAGCKIYRQTRFIIYHKLSAYGRKRVNDISGLIGQYAHGNEPSHHIAYLYNYAGMPFKSAERASYIAKNLYDKTRWALRQ